MAQYYLISQLPSLDAVGDSTPVPITLERFYELCSRHLGSKTLRETENLTLAPNPSDEEKSASPLIHAWNDGERNLRIALGKIRAGKMNKTFDLQNKNIPQELLKVAGTAAEIENPLEAEKFLLQYRLSFLETLRPMDAFSEEYLFYYALKLKLILRIRQFDKVRGDTTYKNIYNSILNGENSEA